jgi:hypothetical protein
VQDTSALVNRSRHVKLGASLLSESIRMLKPRKRDRRIGGAFEPYVHASVSFLSDLYATLEEPAKKKKLLLAWIVRDATERRVANRLTEAAQ